MRTNNIPSEFIRSELTRAGVYAKASGDHIMIVCPFHNDSNPSLGISLGGKVPAGVFHCLGCDRSGTWNELAQKIGVRPWDEGSVSDKLYISRSKKRISQELDDTELILSPWEGKWKTYTAKFLRQFDAQRLWDTYNKDYYMYLPVTYLGDLYSYVKVRVNNDSPGPKYWFPPNLVKCIYPIDVLLHWDTRVLVLVEGVGDVFRCLRYGIPAGALLGTKVTAFMKEQLEILGPKVIIICMDGDTAGRRAVLGYKTEGGKHQPGIIDSLKNDFDIRVLFPPTPELTDSVDSHDPDSMPYTYIQVLRHLVLSNNGVINADC